MKSVYQNNIYKGAIRPPTKTVQHCCTGKTEIQRISRNFSYDDLEYCLFNSKMLHRYLERHPLQKEFNQQLFEELCQIKNIHNSENKFHVRRTLQIYHCYKLSIQHIESLRTTKYDKSNLKHEQKLIDIWQNLKPKDKLKNRISKQWIEIGFQDEDPATDFRGAGYLGLVNLYNFVQLKSATEIFDYATKPETEYFFCSASLFLTMLAVDLIKQRLIPIDFWEFQSEKQILINFQRVFNMLFFEFDRFWHKCEDKSMMQFNVNLNVFKTQVKSNNPFRLKQLTIYWAQKV